MKILLLAFVVALASLSAKPIAAYGEPMISCASPEEGEVLRARTFPLLYVMSGIEASDGLDHVHWQLDDEQPRTAPDLNGADEVSVPSDGTYTLTVWMATDSHGLIGEKRSVTFRVVTSGVSLLTPEPDEVVETFDPILEYSPFGEPSEQLSSYYIRIDGSLTIVERDLDGRVALKGLTNGRHTVEIWMADEQGEPLHEVASRSFTVKSSLTRANVLRALSLARTASRSGGLAPHARARLSALLRKMSLGGSRHPVDRWLRSARVREILRMVDRRAHDRSIRIEVVRALEELLSSEGNLVSPRGGISGHPT
jgi:hypothetical protein